MLEPKMVALALKICISFYCPVPEWSYTCFYSDPVRIAKIPVPKYPERFKGRWYIPDVCVLKPTSTPVG